LFCTIKGLEHLGWGKLIDTTGENCTVEYFDSPAHALKKTHSIPRMRVTPSKLGSNTRIYYQDNATRQWLVGRVLRDVGDGVEVRYKGVDSHFEYQDVFVRCKKPIEDPVDYLANLITETPKYAEARSGFLKSYISQRGVVSGISSLLSSIIELESHQINVIRRILSDPSQRYLLADEVGLGKTIEAGVVIRQAVLDDLKNHHIVVLVPRTLVQQWRQELIKRFGLYGYIDLSVIVVAQDSLEEIDSNLAKATLLVIDEVHHVASGVDAQSKFLYDLVQAHSKNIERLLLLSATPVLRNESGFLRMLHLLDPVIYNLDDEDGFHAKIAHRQILAEAVASLDPQNVLFLDSVLDNLVEILPDDDRLLQLIGNLRQELVGLPDENNPTLIESIRILRAHLSETYRLTRRILRNRRKRVTGLTIDRNGARIVPITEIQLERIEPLLESWRIGASEIEDSNQGEMLRHERAEFFWKIVSSLLTEPGEIRSICEERINIINETPALSFDNEMELLQDLKGLIDQEQWLKNRLDCLIDEVVRLLTSRCKIVIFCSKELTADAVYRGLLVQFNETTVVRHKINENEDEDEDEDEPLWFRFNTCDEVRIIVCDSRAEEGINLQGGEKIVIHFDLPIEPNRIEQRMGRVDRYGSGSPVKSLVLVDEQSKYQFNLYSVLNAGLGVFDHSISSLQYLVETELKELRETLFSEGVEAIETLVNKLSGPEGYVSKELKLIDQQDGLDELSQLAEIDLEPIFDVDCEWKDIHRLALHWAVDILMFDNITERGLVASNQTPIDPPFRFQYKVPGHGGHATLLPINDFIGDFLGVLDYEYRYTTSRSPFSYPHCSRRPSALKNGTRLLRYGDEFIEALKKFSDFDDRGRSYAMWRQVHKGFTREEREIYFRFDFLIETRLDEAISILKEGSETDTDTAISAISRRGDALFSPLVVQVWINAEGEEPNQEFIDKYLMATYENKLPNGDYIDTNLNSMRFLSLMGTEPDTFENWGERCHNMREQAHKILITQPLLTDSKIDAIGKAQMEDEVREAQLVTRIRMLDGVEKDMEQKRLVEEKRLNSALYQGIENPSIKVDVVGVVLLSGDAFPIVQ
jgi:ATP-dependent helicase HepA